MREYRKLSAAKLDTRPVEQVIIFYAGWLGHYVATVRSLFMSPFNSRLGGADPNGYNTGHQIHWQFEGPFVEANMHEADVRATMTPVKAIDGDMFDAYVAYLRNTKTYVEKVYQLDKVGGFIGAGTPESRQFTAERLGAGASMLRDMIYTAWLESAKTGARPLRAKIGLAQPPSSAAATAGMWRSTLVSIRVVSATAGMAITSHASIAWPVRLPIREMMTEGELCSKAPASKGWLEPKPMSRLPRRTKGRIRATCMGMATQFAA